MVRVHILRNLVIELNFTNSPQVVKNVRYLRIPKNNDISQVQRTRSQKSLKWTLEENVNQNSLAELVKVIPTGKASEIVETNFVLQQSTYTVK